MSLTLTSISEPALFPAGMLVQQTASDSEQMKEIAAFWRIEQEQLEPGRYFGRIAAFHTPRVQLALTHRSRSTRILGYAPERAIVFGLPLPSAHPTYFRCRRLATQEIAVAPTGEEFMFQAMGESRVISVAICCRLVRARALAMWGEPFENRCHDGRLTLSSRISAGHVAEMLSGLIVKTLAHSDQLFDDAQCTRIEDTILRALLAAVEPSRGPVVHSERRQFAMRAKEYLRAHANEPLRMAELCGEIGRSSRTLEIGFREAFGMSLKARLQAMRLNGAHRDLRAARGSGKSVKEVAMKWGFMHLGRFSVNYRKWFGESPSETLGRPLQAAGAEVR